MNAVDRRMRRCYQGGMNESIKADMTATEGAVPYLDVGGTTREAGIQLGYAWTEALHCAASRLPRGSKPWWMQNRFARLIDSHAPHLPELYRGMAEGAGIPEDRCTDAHPAGPAAGEWPDTGCTSFAVAPSVAVDGHAFCGQTKDTARRQQYRYVVLRLRLSDAPPALTLTYPGLLFGHGFVAGGCAIFRNSLYAGESAGELPYSAWGLLALHCASVEDAVRFTRDHTPRTAAHCTVADEAGGIAGIEIGRGGIAVRAPADGLYVHANAVMSGEALRRYEEAGPMRENSLRREARLRALLERGSGKLSPSGVFAMLADHADHPCGICRHESDRMMTTAAVVVEPTRRRLSCTRGAPCRSRPATWAL